MEFLLLGTLLLGGIAIRSAVAESFRQRQRFRISKKFASEPVALEAPQLEPSKSDQPLAEDSPGPRLTTVPPAPQSQLEPQPPEHPEPKAVRVRPETPPASQPMITDEFRAAAELVSAGQNLFVTGRAGTGKTTLLRYLIRHTTGPAAVLAPTGLAAVNAGGQTIHSFFRFPARLLRSEDIRPSRNRSAIRQLKTLFVDEVSMVRSDLMNAVDRSLRINRKNEIPFGGVQVVLIGDMHQLPPIVSTGQEREYLYDHFGGCYFFNAPVFNSIPVNFIELTTNFRQRDVAFSTVLDQVSEGMLGKNALDTLNQQVISISELSDEYVILAPHNETVSQINTERLESLEIPELQIEAEVRGEYDPRIFPTEETLRLRVGAKVVFLRNDPQGRWVNGTLGEVSRLDHHLDRVWVRVESNDYEVTKIAWENVRYVYDSDTRKLSAEIVGSFTQLPLRLAWALTIHKSQGMTLNNVCLDLDRGAFAHGQTYVALSRCRSLAGLALARPLSPADLIFDPDALAYRNLLRPVAPAGPIGG